MLTQEQGIFLVKFARGVIEGFVKGEEIKIPEKCPAVFAERRGVFVTLEKYPSGELRGCIGLPYPCLLYTSPSPRDS